jgi:hypothetical protein
VWASVGDHLLLLQALLELSAQQLQLLQAHACSATRCRRRCCCCCGVVMLLHLLLLRFRKGLQ